MTTRQPDLTAASAAFAAFLDALGIDRSADSELNGTPERVAELYAELVAGPRDERVRLEAIPRPGGPAAPVVIGHIPFASLCVHHMVPFFGHVGIVYVPNSHIAGFGAFVRLVQQTAARPQLQERLVAEVAEAMREDLAPQAGVVVARARQFCVELRGAKQRASFVATAAFGEWDGRASDVVQSWQSELLPPQ